jgi:HD-GYP domain-containing protein (c-di-GMP phosphodiesterase class II)
VDLLERVELLNSVGIALSAERDMPRLLERILTGAQLLAHADGGTLYMKTADERLRFEILRNNRLGIAMGGTSGVPVDLQPIALYGADGAPNHHMVAAQAVLLGHTVNIADAYSAAGYDFSGTQAFDQRIGYHSQSFLTVPMTDHSGAVIGVLQLINALDPLTQAIVPFSAEDQRLVESLASQAAVALTNQRLMEELRELLEKFIELIALAIDEKSAYTGGHCRRVPELGMLLMEAACAASDGPLKDFNLSDAGRYEMKIAGLLHDCGKITTPVHIVDKSTKLETIFDRITLIDTRIEVIKRDAVIAMLEARLAADGGDDLRSALAEQHGRFIEQLDADREFLRRCNIGGEFMADDKQQRVRDIAQRYTWTTPDGDTAPLLSDDEIDNLCIARGTLTAAERDIINGHMLTTIRMLESLPFPQHLRNVPEIAGGHHERMDGKGYPRGLTREQLSVQARILGIADIFEALTAADRPYKQPMPLSVALTILGRMKLDAHIDPDLFDLFLRDKVYLRYGERFLTPEQIDAIDFSSIPGCPDDLK